MEEEKKVRNIGNIILSILITASITFVATSSYYIANIANGKYTTIAKVTYEGDFSKLATIKGIIDQSYIGDYDEEKLQDGAIAGMLEAVGDPYTTYYSKEDVEDLLVQTEGKYDGVGLYITSIVGERYVQVITAIPNTPAYEAGILTGDYITAVDGVEYGVKEITKLSNALKGQKGTKVKVSILRVGENGEETRLEKEVMRDTIELDTVGSRVLRDKIGYIEITTFTEGTYRDFKEQYEKLIKEDKIKGLILDLRNNPGGILDISTSIADMLVPEGEIVYTLDKNGTKKVINSDANQIEIPLVILVNEGTASASEILTGAVKDYDKGTIVGTKTYGKGIVQEVKSLGDGTMMKLTTSEYFTPKGTKIHEVGIMPDIEVDLPEELKDKIVITDEEDTQLQRAIEEIIAKY